MAADRADLFQDPSWTDAVAGKTRPKAFGLSALLSVALNTCLAPGLSQIELAYIGKLRPTLQVSCAESATFFL